MNSDEDILRQFQSGSLSLEETLEQLKANRLANLGHTRLDLARRERTGISEVIYGEGKTPSQILEIAERLLDSGHNVLATRLTSEGLAACEAHFTDAVLNPMARMASIVRTPTPLSETSVGIVSAGTSDMPVAEEAAFTVAFLGSRVERFYDCGVAGLHRLLDELENIRRAKVLIAVAGMEGALPTVLAGLVCVPVIAVPTSIGYGTGFNGLSALLSMLNSCANGVSVVNIDNGFGAGYNAHLINTIS